MRNAAARSNLLVPEVREVMDIRQASDYLGISPDTLYKYASEGFVPHSSWATAGASSAPGSTSGWTASPISIPPTPSSTPNRKSLSGPQCERAGYGDQGREQGIEISGLRD